MQKSLETALQKISSKLLITDKDLKVLFINSSAEDFLNTTSKKCEGKLIHDVFIEKPITTLSMPVLLIVHWTGMSCFYLALQFLRWIWTLPPYQEDNWAGQI